MYWLYDVCSSSSQPISRLNAVVFLYLQPSPDGRGSLGKITIVCAGADGDGAAVASAVPRIARRRPLNGINQVAECGLTQRASAITTKRNSELFFALLSRELLARCIPRRAKKNVGNLAVDVW